MTPLGPEDYPVDWADDVYDVAAEFTGLINDIRHHEIGDAWDVVSNDAVFELARLRGRFDEMTDVIARGRRRLDRLDRVARLKAARRRRATPEVDR